MKTGDFNSSVTSKMLNESMFKKFGKHINFERYTREQLEDYRNVLRTEVHQIENSSGFNELLSNESYQQDKHLLSLLNTRIKEMLGEAAKKPQKPVKEVAVSKSQQKAAGIALAAKRKGDTPKGKGAAAQMSKMSTKELKKFASTPHKGLPVKKKKLTKVSENIGVDPAAKKIFDKIKGTPNLIKNGQPTPALDFYIKKYLGTVSKGESDIPMLKAEIMDLLQGSGLGETRNTDMVRTGKDLKDLIDAGLAKGPAGLNLKQAPAPSKKRTETDADKKDQRLTTAAKREMGLKEAKPDFLDFDKDGNKKEPMKKALADKKKMKKGFPPAKKPKKKSKIRESQLKNDFRMILEGIRYYIAEDEEGKAMDITAGADMVKDFTSWMQRLGQYQTKSTIELADSIRSNFGPEEAEQFKSAVTPAIQSALEALTASREIITKAVSVLAGEEQPETPMGEIDDEEPSFEPEADSMNMPPEEEDEFAASDAAAGGSETTGREKRESREYSRLKKLAEAHSIMKRLAG